MLVTQDPERTSPRRLVIVEFDSPEAARTFYFSDVYQAVLPFRLNASTGNGFGCLLTGVR